MELNKYTDFSKDNPFGSQAKMIHHVDRLKEYKEKGDTFPIFMEVNLTDICNMRCDWCISDNRLDENPTDTLDVNKLLPFIRDYKRLGGKALTWSGGGEPTVYKHFREITEVALEEGIELGLMTNGGFRDSLMPLIGESFKWIRISLDTLNHENYKKWKGVDFIDRIMRQVKELRNYPTKVGINVNVNADMTINEMQQVIDECYEITDYIQFRPVLPRYFREGEEKNINLEVWEYLSQYEENAKINLSYDKLKDLKGNAYPFSSCEGHYFSPILNADGNVKICMYHPNRQEFSFGNINDKTMEEIWNGEQRKKAIEYVRSINYSEQCQQQCKLCELNKFLDFYNNPNENLDINFL